MHPKLEKALPEGVIRPLTTVESETGLPRSSILVKGIGYRASNDTVVRGEHPHKGFVAQTAEPPAFEEDPDAPHPVD